MSDNKNETPARRKRAEIISTILATMLAVHKLFNNEKIIDGSTLRPTIGSIGISNEYVTNLRKKMLVKLSYSEAIKEGHKPGDGKRGVYYMLKNAKQMPNLVMAKKICEEGYIPQSHLNRQAKVILQSRRVKNFTYKNNKLTISFLP